MIEKSFSEGIILRKEGSKSSTAFKSSCNVNTEKSYCTSVYFAPKLVPKRTFYTVNGDSVNTSTLFNRSCSLSNGEKSYESSVSIDQNLLNGNCKGDLKYECDLPYYQNIELEPRLVMKEFSETINNFPKSSEYLYSSSVVYDPCYTEENYVVGLEVQKVREWNLSTVEGECSDFMSSLHIVVDDNPTENSLNGECDSSCLVNGV